MHPLHLKFPYLLFRDIKTLEDVKVDIRKRRVGEGDVKHLALPP